MGKDGVTFCSKELGVQVEKGSSAGEMVLPHQKGNVDLQNPRLVPVCKTFLHQMCP